MPNTEGAAPSTGTPDPGPQCSGRIADQGTRPDYMNKTHERTMVTREIVTEPENLTEAESRSDWPIWKQAMKIEMDQHDEFGTWKLVELPMGRTAIGCRWVYAVKTTPDGDFEKAKAHLFAQGFTQRLEWTTMTLHHW